MTIALNELRTKSPGDPEFPKECETLKPEFGPARKLIETRTSAGLRQCEVANWMGTSQSVTARMGSGQRPSLRAWSAITTPLAGSWRFSS